MYVSKIVFCFCNLFRYTGREYTAESYLASHGIGPVTGYGVSIILLFLLINVRVYIPTIYDLQ